MSKQTSGIVAYAARLRAAENKALAAGGALLAQLCRDTVGQSPSQASPHSQPGHAPFKRSGAGQSGIFNRPGNQTSPSAQIGVRGAGVHLAYLELGVGAAARPWLRATLKRRQSQLGATVLAALRYELSAVKGTP